jgi:hypothetical protein
MCRENIFRWKKTIFTLRFDKSVNTPHQRSGTSWASKTSLLWDLTVSKQRNSVCPTLMRKTVTIFADIINKECNQTLSGVPLVYITEAMVLWPSSIRGLSNGYVNTQMICCTNLLSIYWLRHITNLNLCHAKNEFIPPATIHLYSAKFGFKCQETQFLHWLNRLWCLINISQVQYTANITCIHRYTCIYVVLYKRNKVQA